MCKKFPGTAFPDIINSIESTLWSFLPSDVFWMKSETFRLTSESAIFTRTDLQWRSAPATTSASGYNRERRKIWAPGREKGRAEKRHTVSAESKGYILVLEPENTQIILDIPPPQTLGATPIIMVRFDRVRSTGLLSHAR